MWRGARGSALAPGAVPRKEAEQWWRLTHDRRWQTPKNLGNAEALLNRIGTRELFLWTLHYTWGRGMLQLAQLCVRRWWEEQILCCYCYSDPTYTQGVSSTLSQSGSNEKNCVQLHHLFWIDVLYERVLVSEVFEELRKKKGTWGNTEIRNYRKFLGLWETERRCVNKPRRVLPSGGGGGHHSYGNCFSESS